MSAKIGILGFVNHTHPTPAQFPEDAVMRDGLANHGEGTASWRDMLGRTRRASQRTVIFELGKRGAPTRVVDGHIYAYVIFYMPMRRTALFLKEQQLEK